MRELVQRLLALPSALLLLSLSQAYASRLESRADNATTIPAPISFTPDEDWDGNDGAWSTFTLRVGTPEQYVRTLVSTSSYQTWVVLPEGCIAAQNDSGCVDSRGGDFIRNASSTWDPIGLYDLGLQQNLGYGGDAYYGYDTVGLGGVGEEGPTLKNTTVGAYAVLDFYLGVFGINPKPTNFSGYNEGSPSYMSLLKEQNQIASVSAGFTAGARYRYATGALASLTLGGYDSSKFIENDVEFIFSSDNSRDLEVVIQDITTPSQIENNPQGTSLLPTPIYAVIDSTVSQIWLPIEACLAFEAEFGLVYDNTTNLYLVNDTLHQELTTRNPNVTFQLAGGTSGGNYVQIELPYAAFDLTAQAGYSKLENDSNYFPLRRAQNSSQYTLGRTFLQEAYLTIDWESARFNVSQAVFNQTAQEALVAIPALNDATDSGNGANKSTSSGLSGGDIAGIVVGALAALAVLAILIVWLLHRRSKAAKKRSPEEKLAPEEPDAAVMRGRHPTVFPKAELEGSTPAPYQFHGAAADGANMHLLSAHSTNPNSPHSARASMAGYPTFGASSMSGFVSSASPTTSSHGDSGARSSVHSGVPFSPASITGHSFAGPSSVAGFSHAGSENPVYEMLGDMPTIKEKDGRPLSEKEALQHRERIYNGVNATATTPTESHEEPPPVPTRAANRVQPQNVVPVSSTSASRPPMLHHAFSFERK